MCFSVLQGPRGKGGPEGPIGGRGEKASVTAYGVKLLITWLAALVLTLHRDQ